MGRGRPKGSKNKVKSSGLSQTKLFDTTISESRVTSNVTNNSNVQAVCNLCNKSIYCTPTKISLSLLTGKASWHRNCNVDKLDLCSSCAEELNTLIDKFLISKNSNLNRYKL